MSQVRLPDDELEIRDHPILKKRVLLICGLGDGRPVRIAELGAKPVGELFAYRRLVSGRKSSLMNLIRLATCVLFAVAISAASGAEDTALSGKAKERADTLSVDVAKFCLAVTYVGPDNKSYYNIALSVNPKELAVGDRFELQVRVERKEAEKLIKFLATSGMLDRARATSDPDNSRGLEKVPYYRLTVSTQMPDGKRMFWVENLGWGPPLLERLKALQHVMNDSGVAALKRLTLALGPKEKEIEEKQR